MYPDWINGMFQDNRCIKCRAALTVDDIDAIGARRPEKYEAHAGAPVALVIVTCRRCGQRMHLSLVWAVDQVIDAINELARIIEADAQKFESPFRVDSRLPAVSNDAPKPRENGEQRGGVRPSRRRGQPMNPPTEAEIKAFLNRLRRTSFQRQSKGFVNWLKQFDIKSDGPVSDGDQSQK
jgi:hypothetical protein